MTYRCAVPPCRYLPREVDPLVYNMSHEDPGSVSYSEIGGLAEQIRELREVSEAQTHTHTLSIQDRVRFFWGSALSPP
jgi:ATP-dependent 26S proteasome regulatory subunit